VLTYLKHARNIIFNELGITKNKKHSKEFKMKLQKRVSQKFIATLKNKIAQIEKGCRSRLFKMEDIENFAAEICKLYKKDQKISGYLTSGGVCNSYRRKADATWLKISDGKIEISRDWAKKAAYGAVQTCIIRDAENKVIHKS
jgi:hypothetical protein